MWVRDIPLTVKNTDKVSGTWAPRISPEYSEIAVQTSQTYSEVPKLAILYSAMLQILRSGSPVLTPCRIIQATCSE